MDGREVSHCNNTAFCVSHSNDATNNTIADKRCDSFPAGFIISLSECHFPGDDPFKDFSNEEKLPIGKEVFEINVEIDLQQRINAIPTRSS